MADDKSTSLAKVPIVATVDGWTAESSSTVTPDATPDSVAKDLVLDEPEAKESPETPEEAPVAADATETPEEAPEAEGEEKKLSRAERRKPGNRIAALQREIGALHKTRGDLSGDVEAKKAELEALETKLSSARADHAGGVDTADPKQAATATTESIKAEVDKVLGEKPTWKAMEADGKEWDEYDAARQAYDDKRFELIAKQTEARAEAIATERVNQERQRADAAVKRSRYELQLEQIREAEPEFDTLVAENLEGIDRSPFMDAVITNHPQGAHVFRHVVHNPDEARVLSALTPPMEVFDAVQQSSDPAGVLSYIATHQAEYQEIVQLRPDQQLLALGRLVGQVEIQSAGGAKSSGSPPAPKPISEAKPPIQPVGGASSTESKDLDALPFHEYVDQANDADRSRGRRRRA